MLICQQKQCAYQIPNRIFGTTRSVETLNLVFKAWNQRTFIMGLFPVSTNPIGTQFYGIWFPIFIFAKGGVTASPSNLTIVFDDKEVVHRVIMECLLWIYQRQSFLEERVSRTAAVIPAVPAPSTATCVFLHLSHLGSNDAVRTAVTVLQSRPIRSSW